MSDSTPNFGSPVLPQFAMDNKALIDRMVANIHRAVNEARLEGFNAARQHYESILADKSKLSTQFSSDLLDVALRSTSLQQERDELRDTLQALTDRMKFVFDSGAYQAVWQCSYIHMGQYDGPQFSSELSAALQLLERLKIKEPNEPTANA